MSKKPKYKEGMVVHPGIGERIADIVILAILVLCMFIAVVPMWHTVMVSLSDGQLVIAHNGILWKWLTGDGSINWAGYEKTLNYSNFAIIKSYGITLVYVVGNVVFGLIMNVIGAYCLFRKSKLTTFMTLFFIFTMMFGGGVVPTYMVIRSLGMTGNHLVSDPAELYQCHVYHHDNECIQAGTVLHHRVSRAGRSRTFYHHVPDPAAPGHGSCNGMYDQHRDPGMELLVRSIHLCAYHQGDLAVAAVDQADRCGQRIHPAGGNT